MQTTIALPDELAALVDAKVASGRYASADAVIRRALLLLEAVESGDTSEDDDLRLAWQEGIDSGDAGPLDFAELREAAASKLAALRRA